MHRRGPRPSCCCASLGALLKGKQIGPGRQSEPLRLGTVTADCPPGAVLLAAQRAARARWACGLALYSPSYISGAGEFVLWPGPAAGSEHATIAVALCKFSGCHSDTPLSDSDILYRRLDLSFCSAPST